jgi:hypothetical protein
MAMLEDLVELYPFSYPVHTSYAYALKRFKPEQFQAYLTKAAIYIPDRNLLHKIIHQVEQFETNEATLTATMQPSAMQAETPSAANEPATRDEGFTFALDHRENIERTEETLNDGNIFHEAEQPNELSPLEEIAFAVSEVVENNENPTGEPETEESFGAEDLTALNESDLTKATAYVPPPAFEEESNEVKNAIDQPDSHGVSETIEASAPGQTLQAEVDDPQTGDPDEAVYPEVAEIDYTNTALQERPVPADIENSFGGAPQGDAAKEDEVPDAETEPQSNFIDVSPVAEAENNPDQTAGDSSGYAGEVNKDITESSQPSFEPETKDSKEETNDARNLGASASTVPLASAAFDNTIETVIPYFDDPSFEEASLSQQSKTESAPSAGQLAEPPQKTEERQEIIGNIASTDYFVFDKSSIDPLLKDEDSSANTNLAVAASTSPKEILVNEGTVSRYDDDKMPFSFLWWLNKTRKEHADTYQPYAPMPTTAPEAPAKKITASPLEQQIMEHIFHIQPEINVLPTENLPPVSKEVRRPEDAIIEKFITEDPQIRPPKADKLDTENKARKSSEDHLDLVSETLAKIYTDQMLYHKAIDTYQKLSLKFPEKSTYFAGRIQEIEKKINS